MNWGKGIAIFIALFVVIMIAMVLFSSRQTNEMMDGNYYHNELDIQNSIDAKSNLNVLGKNYLLKNTLDHIEFTFPYNTYDAKTIANTECLRLYIEKLVVKTSIWSLYLS